MLSARKHFVNELFADRIFFFISFDFIRKIYGDQN